MAYQVTFWHPEVKIENFPELTVNKQYSDHTDSCQYLLDTDMCSLEQFLHNHKDHWIAVKDKFMYIDTRMFKQR